jgi:hypothetical protein
MVFSLFIQSLFTILYIIVDYNSVFFFKKFTLFLKLFFFCIIEPKLKSNCMFFCNDGWIERQRIEVKKSSKKGGRFVIGWKCLFASLIFLRYLLIGPYIFFKNILVWNFIFLFFSFFSVEERERVARFWLREKKLALRKI